MLNVDGLITGLDTKSIVDGLLQIQQQQVDRVTARKQSIQAEQTAFHEINTRISALQSSVGKLTRLSGSVFRARAVTVSDEQAMVASATEKAATGVYRLRVNSLASAHQVASQAFTSASDEITQGSLTIQAGAGEAKTITIDKTTNTVQGLADSINNSGIGVTAAVLDTGKFYRLLISSNTTGEAGAVTITNNLAESAGDAVQPVFDTVVQAATDAEVQIGSGEGAILVHSSDNQVDGFLPGLNLDLVTADADKEIVINVKQDIQAGKEAIQEFVTAFNDVTTFINDQSNYDAEAQQAGLLLGNRDASTIQTRLRNAVLGVVQGVKSEARTLSQIGIRFDQKGVMSLDEGKLNDVMSGKVDNVDIDDVRRLFALDGRSSTPGIRFILGSQRTKETALAPDGKAYEVDILSAAEQATLSSKPLASLIAVDSTNNNFRFTLDGTEAEITLDEGAFTGDQLAAQLQAKMNAVDDLGAREVAVTFAQGALHFNSASYGRDSEFQVQVAGENSAHQILGFDGGEADRGLDVVGKFIVKGKKVDGELKEEEAAVGRGRLLSGSKSNDYTADIQLEVTLTANQIQAGAEGTLEISRGFAARLDQVLRDLVQNTTDDQGRSLLGTLPRTELTFKERLNDIDEEVDRLNERFDARRTALLAKFAAMESAIADLQANGATALNSLVTLPTSIGGAR